MPFSSSFVNPRLEDEFLIVTIGGKTQEFDLDTCLGNVRGKFQWGGQDFFSAARSLSLRGSVLSGELKRKNDWVKDEIDLGDRIQDVNGKPTYVASKLGNGHSAPIVNSSESTTVSKNNFVEELKAYKSSHQSTYSERSSSYFKFSVSLSLRGTLLIAETRQAGQEGLISSDFDLDANIGLVDGKLIWGRKGFSSACTNIRLQEGFILFADYEGTSISIDLSRYLQTYSGKLGPKVTITSDGLSDLFSEARWIKFKVTTEPDAAEAFSLVSGEKSVFKAAFSALAETTAQQVVEEMTEEFTADAEQFVQSTVTTRVREEITRIISQKVSQQAEEEIINKVKVAFSEAQETILAAFSATQQTALEACAQMVNTASSELTEKYTESVVASMTEQITSQWKSTVQSLLTEVSTSTVAQFQERAEILLEREIVGAKIRRAETQANILQRLLESGI